MRKALLLGLLLAALAAPTLGATFGHAWFDMNISELPASCDPGRVFMIKDGATASDCVTGSGSDIHGCVCDSGGASYTALSALAAPGGATTQVQFNNAGTLDGDDDFKFDGSDITIGNTTATSQVILPISDDAVTPTLSFGGNSGFYEYTTDALKLSLAGAFEYYWAATSFGMPGDTDTGLSAAIMNEDTSATNPVFVPRVADDDLGIGSAAVGQLSLISGGEEFARVTDPGDVASGEVFRLNGPDRTTPADDDEFYISFNLEDSAPAFDEFARISAIATDVTTTEEDGAISFDVVAGGTDTEVMRLASSGTGQVVQLLLPAINQEANPTLGFDDGDSGLYESQTDVLSMSLNASEIWQFQSLGIYSTTSGSPGFQNEDATATNPTLLPTGGDADTGWGSAALDQLSGIAGGEEFLRLTDPGDVVSGEVIRFAAPNRATPADNDEGYISFFNEESGGGSEEFSRISWAATDVTTTEEDAALIFEVDVAGSLFEGMRLQSDGTDHAQLMLPQGNWLTAPTLALDDDGNSGFYGSGDNTIVLSLNGASRVIFADGGLRMSPNGPEMLPITPTNTNPSLVADVNDSNTGVGKAAADQFTIVAGNDEAWTFAEGAYGTASGDSVAFVSDLVTAPTSNPTGGVLLYSDADTLYIRDTGGTVTDLGAAGSAPNWEDLTHSADTATSFVGDNDAETFTVDFQSAFGADRFTIQQTTGNPTAGSIFNLSIADSDADLLKATGTGSTVLMLLSDPGDVVSGEVLRLAGPNRATPADNDEAYISFFNEESGLGSEEFSRLSWGADDVTATEEDGFISFDVDVAGSLVEAMRLQGDGVDSTQLVLPQVDDAANPTLSYGDADTGTFSPGDNNISWAVGGTEVMELTSSSIFRGAVGSPRINLGSTADATTAVFNPNKLDADTGVGAAGLDQFTVVAGGDEAWTFSEEAYGTAAGDSVAFVSDLVTAPTSNPTGGVLLYSDADTLYIRDTGGTVTDLGGAASGTNLNDIGDSTAAGAVGSAEWAQTWTWDTGDVTAAAFDGFTIQMDYHASTTDSGDQNLVKLEMIDNAIDATGQPEALLLIDNNDANDAPAYGLRIDDTQPWGSSALLLPVQNDASTPTLAFGAGTDGIYQLGGGVLNFSTSGDLAMTIGSGSITAGQTNSWSLMEEGSTNINPTFNPRGEATTGIGSGSDSDVSIIANSRELQRLTDPGDVASGEVVRLIAPNRAVPADDDEAYLSLFNEDSGSTSEEFSRISWIADDVTTTEEDGSLSFDVRVAGSLVEGMRLQGDGVDSTQLLLPQVADAANPTLAFGDGDSGLYESADDVMWLVTQGQQRWRIDLTDFRGNGTDEPSLRGVSPSATVPSVVPANNDNNTGVGTAGADQFTIVAGADEAWTFAEGAYGTSAGDSVAFVSDLVTAPTSNPTGGVLLYSDADSLFVRDTGGTVTDLTAAGGAPGGSDNDVQYKSGASFAGDSDFTFDGTDVEIGSVTTTSLLTLPSSNDAVTPTLTIGAGGDGIYQESTQLLTVALDGAGAFTFDSTGTDDLLTGFGAGTGWIEDAGASQSNPTVGPANTDLDTGLGWSAADTLVAVAGGQEVVKFFGDTAATSWVDIIAPTTGNHPIIRATGEANRNLVLEGSGTGGVDLTDGTTLAANDIEDTEIDTMVVSYPWLASGTFTDEADCNAPARVAGVGGSGGPAMATVTCPLGGTNLDGDIYGNTIMPPEWDAGTVTLEIEVRIHDDPGATETMQGVFNAQCVGDEDVISNSWTANTGLDVTFVTGDAQWDTQRVTSAALTPDGTCAAGDAIYWRYVVCDTGTPPTTGCSASTHDVVNTHIVGFRMAWTSNVS